MKSALWVVFMLWVLSAASLALAAEDKNPDPKLPIEIVAQTMEADKAQQSALFRGNVVATRGEMTLYADELTLFFVDDKNQPSRQRIEYIEARGKVCVVDGERIAKSNEMDYRQEAQEIVLRGDVSVQEGENLVTGDEIILDLRDNQTRVKSQEGGRIKAIFQPSQESE